MSTTTQDPVTPARQTPANLMQGAFTPPASQQAPSDDSQMSVSVAPQDPAPQSDTEVTLDSMNEILDQVEAASAQQQQLDTAAQQQLPRSFKERAGSGQSSNETISIDAGSGIQMVESEKNPEIPTEVESFLQRVEDHASKAPQEIVVTDVAQAQTQQYFPTKPVLVLPITQKDEKEGKKKSLTEGFRWLVEWSQKLANMFVGKIIYKQEKT